MTLALRITTPMDLVLEAEGLAAVRGADASGGFGIWPGHAEFLTVMPASVLSWRAAGAPWRFAALRGGVLRVTGGARIEVACRAAVLGEDLAALEAEVARAEAARRDAARVARGAEIALHGRAIRALMRHLSAAGGPDPLAEAFR